MKKVENHCVREITRKRRNPVSPRTGIRCNTKAILLRLVHLKNAPTTTSVGHQHAGAFEIRGRNEDLQKASNI